MLLNDYNVNSWALPKGTIKQSTRYYDNTVIARHGDINIGDRKFDRLDKPSQNGRRPDFALDYRRCLRCELGTVFGDLCLLRFSTLSVFRTNA